MTRSAARLALASLAVFLMLGVAPAFAGYENTVKGAHHDCGAGHYPLQGHYSVQVLVKALATLSTSDVEYTTCKDALEAAIRAAEKPKKHHSSSQTQTTTTSTTTTSTSTTHTSRSHTKHHGKTTQHPRGNTGGTGLISSQQISAAVTRGQQPQNVDGVLYTPGAITTRNSSFISSIPTPVLAVLAALILVLGALGGLAVRNIVRARRTG
jgi:cobalamin biosynthesis Mg chelatase CobN